VTPPETDERIARFADMFSAMGTEPRLRIVRLLLSAHPDGMVVSEIGSELGIPASTLSHHLDKLKNEELVRVRREGTFLRYSANADALRECWRSSTPSAAPEAKPFHPRVSFAKSSAHSALIESHEKRP